MPKYEYFKGLFEVAVVKSMYRGADKSLARPDWKKLLNGHQFPSDAEVIAAAETCFDGQPSELFFWVACQKRSQSLVAVACFLPGRVKDLSAHRYMWLKVKIWPDFKGL